MSPEVGIAGIDANVLMEVFHYKEYLELVKSYFQMLPDFNSFNQFDICKSLINEIPEAELNELFISKMKERRVHNEFFNKINRELNQVCLSMNLDRKKRDSLIQKLSTNTV